MSISELLRSLDMSERQYGDMLQAHLETIERLEGKTILYSIYLIPFFEPFFKGVRLTPYPLPLFLGSDL